MKKIKQADQCLLCLHSRGKYLVWNNDTFYPGYGHQPHFPLLTKHQRIETGTKHSAIYVVVIFFLFITWDCGKRKRHPWESHACEKKKNSWTCMNTKQHRISGVLILLVLEKII